MRRIGCHAAQAAVLERHVAPTSSLSKNTLFTVIRGLTAAECFREIEENEVFWPTA